MKVLIVDDSSLIRERLRDLLTELPGIEIIGEAQDKPEAIDSVQKLNPDVVILDICMPNGNGIDVLQDIKKNGPSRQVIVLTNYTNPYYQQKCTTAGADFFFDKATDFEKITEVLKQMLEVHMFDNFTR